MHARAALLVRLHILRDEVATSVANPISLFALVAKKLGADHAAQTPCPPTRSIYELDGSMCSSLPTPLYLENSCFSDLDVFWLGMRVGGAVSNSLRDEDEQDSSQHPRLWNILRKLWFSANPFRVECL